MMRTTLTGLRRRAARSDLMVVAAAMTTFAVFGLVPLLAIGVRISAALIGSGEVRETAAGIAKYVPGPLGLDRHVLDFAAAAARAPWWTIAVALLPISLYAEGIVRCLERFSRADETVGRTLRGRLLTPVLVGYAIVVVVLLVGVVRPLFGGLGEGTGGRLLGVFVAFNLLFFPLFAGLLVVYRFFASTPLRRGPLLAGAFVAASWLAGQLLGYVLAVRFVGGFDNAFGGYAPAATVAAFAFLIYLEHLVFLLGYLLALVLHEKPTTSGE